MKETVCRDCFARAQAALRRCAACGGPRVVSHAELSALAIAHIDCDAFYAAVEKRDDPSLADRPVIIGGGRRGVVATACYVARMAGVRSAMPMFKALALCPDAVVLRPRMQAYAEASRAVRALFETLTPLVEPLSLDEAFLDLTGADRLHGAPPAVSLARLQARIAAEVGVTVSVGLSHNKFLAKLASELDKPNGFSVVGRGETLDFLAPRPVSAIWGVGAALEKRLHEAGLRRIGDLRALDRADLFARFGAMGARLHDLAQGRDVRAVRAERAAKSVSSETTFDADIGAAPLLEAHLWRLCEKVSARLKQGGLSGRAVTLKLKTARFRTLTRRATLGAPTALARALFRAAEPLLREAAPAGPFRLIGVGVAQLAPDDGASGLFDDAGASAERAVDAIRARFGDAAIQTGRGVQARWRDADAAPQKNSR